MKWFYDFHLHTVLSPCGDENMTPNNIVNFAKLLGFNIIAITDHNSTENIEACMKVASEADLIIIPGLEVETIEEIHVTCLFPNLESCKEFGKIVEKKLNIIPNNEKIFGEQLIMDENDEVIGKKENLLIASTNMDIYEVVNSAKELGGIAIPAHIDRASHSIISNLGFIPEDLEINLVEFSKNAEPEKILDDLKVFSKKNYSYIISSDAHYLDHMLEPKYFFEFENKPEPKDIIEKLKSL